MKASNPLPHMSQFCGGGSNLQKPKSSWQAGHANMQDQPCAMLYQQPPIGALCSERPGQMGSGTAQADLLFCSHRHWVHAVAKTKLYLTMITQPWTNNLLGSGCHTNPRRRLQPKTRWHQTADASHSKTVKPGNATAICTAPISLEGLGPRGDLLALLGLSSGAAAGCEGWQGTKPAGSSEVSVGYTPVGKGGCP